MRYQNAPNSILRVAYKVANRLTWVTPHGPHQRRNISQLWGDKTSKIHVQFHIGVPSSEYLFIVYIRQ